jgi:hypothetical protein
MLPKSKGVLGNFLSKNNSSLAQLISLIVQEATPASGGGSSELSPAVYPVYLGGPYPTIASAIAKAVADGHNIGNQATILISPRSDNLGWPEDILLQPGINIQGVWSWQENSVLINGTISYTPGNGGAPVQKVNVSNLWVQAPVGRPCVEVVGASLGKLYLKECILSKVDAGDATPVIGMNGHPSSTLFIKECTGNLLAAGTAYQITSGQFAATDCDISSSAAARGLHVGASGSADMTNVTLACSGPDVVNVALGGSCTLTRCRIQQLQANGSGVVQQGDGGSNTSTSIECIFTVPPGAGYAVQGTGKWLYANNIFTGNANVLSAAPGQIVPVPLATSFIPV